MERLAAVLQLAAATSSQRASTADAELVKAEAAAARTIVKAGPSLDLGAAGPSAPLAEEGSAEAAGIKPGTEGLGQVASAEVQSWAFSACT